MTCPKQFVKKKVEVDSSVQNYEFFNNKFVDEWTFKHFFDWLNPRGLEQIESHLREYKASLNSLSKKGGLNEDLKAFIGSLKAQTFSKEELRNMLTAKKTDTQINITMSKPTIYSADDHSRIYINNNQGSSENVKNKRKSLDTNEDRAVNNIDIDTSLHTTFVVDGTNILPLWNKYKIESNSIVTCGSATVESDMQRLLSQAHILLLKKDEVSPGILKLFGREKIDTIKKQIISMFNIQAEEFPIEIECNMRVVIKQLFERSINSRQASSKLIKLCSDSMNSPVDNCIIIVRNLVERLPQKKMNTKTKESNLCGTFIDAVIRPILDDPDNDEFLVWSNIKVSDRSDDRPDISGLILIDSKLDGPTCIGEVKGEDRTNDTYALAVDLMKVAIFSKESIDTKHYKGVLGIHVIGFRLTLYVTTLLAEGLYVVYEIASISIPANLYDIRGFIANLEDLIPVKTMYKQCIEVNEKVQLLKKKGSNLQTICQSVKSGKDRKRHCSFVFSH